MPFDIETSVGFLLAKAHQRLFARFRDILMPHGVTPPQFALLAFLWKRDGLSQTELTEKTEVDRTTLSGLIDRLEKQGLVARIPHPGDRRAYLVTLTAAGRKLEAELTPLAMSLRQQISADLTADEYEQLCQLLKRMRGACDD
ncbi:MarR family winged helix-turn-helix transcriptional regulator [Malonomonas rubra]|uniref:MarR family winged helix-turn-helix transcriptional regulator n=1 Tax=Malonomonas rubra TaxID=57040 RepID=UPI0026EEA55C|nr:MarR family transcriptional regulator [Malonomonas rubra]